MDARTLYAILACVQNTKEVIERLTGAWPCSNFRDADIHEMFYQLNTMALKLYEKIDEMEGENNDQRES